MIKEDLEGDLEGTPKSKGTSEGLGRGLVSSSGQVKDRSDPGMVQFTAQINTLELDSEVGRLVRNIKQK